MNDYPRLCGGCRTFSSASGFERVDLWPVEEVCSFCAQDIRESDEDGRTEGNEP